MIMEENKNRRHNLKQKLARKQKQKKAGKRYRLVCFPQSPYLA